MPSTLLLRTLLLACAVSGSLVFACSSDPDTSKDDNSASEDDDEDDDSKAKKDAGRDAGKKDAKASTSDDEDDDAEACTAPGEACECESGMMGFAACTAGVLGECGCVETSGEFGEPIEMCPGMLSCANLPIPVPVPGLPPGGVCLRAGGAFPLPPTCPESKDCNELDLPGAQCITIATFSVCVQPCTLGAAPPAGTGDAGTGGSTTGDAGRSDAGTGGSSTGDAGRADAGRADAGR